MDRRQQLTALRKELKSANKERRREIQLMIVELEAARDQNAVTSESAVQENEQEMEHQRLKAEHDRAKRREKEEKAETERIRLTEEARARIAEGPRLDLDEMSKIEALLSANKLSIFMIEPDGNCLFEAVSHQLSYNSNLTYHQAELRKMAAQYINSNVDKYAPFIDYEEHGVATVEEYCGLVCRNGWWGGDLEMDALANALKAKITVFKADGPYSFGPDDDSVLTVNISFHRHQFTLGAHYNSLVSLASSVQ
jgi:OTU domain-containing protein 6